jgi:iron complex transport system ATP-binding protein
MSENVVLEVDQLAAGYDDLDVIRNISFSLLEGDMLGIVGPNGSGKSTLLKALTRSIPVHSGRVRIHGRDLSEFRANDLAQTVSVIPQSSPLPEGFSALEIALMGRTPYLRLLQSERPSDLALARRSMLQTDTLHLAERSVSDLSGGERQRVVVARALTQQSPILLMDEPTVHMDIGHQLSLLDLIVELQKKQHLSVVTVVHDLTLAAQYCDRLILLSEGEIFAAGTVESVLNPDTIRAVYNAGVRVDIHPDTGRPYVLPVPGFHKHPADPQ